MNTVNIISQTVDTIKTHYKILPTIADENFEKYINLVTSLISLKKEAQETKNNYGSTKSINYFLGKHKFNILPTSITGFSLVIQNSDFSIAMRQTKNKINNSPLIKVEFRAEYLARVGYIKCIEVVNTLVKNYILSDYEIDISEIHLATDIQGYEFKIADFVRMKTRARNGNTHEEESLIQKASMYGTATTFTGFVFGSGEYMLRIYNKSKEIEKFKKKSFAKFHLWEQNENYNPGMNVWRLEIQIRRSKLKKLVNSNGNTMDNYYNCLNGIADLWNKAMTDYEIKDISRDNTSNLFHGNRVFKNGTTRELTKDAIQKIYKRSPSLPFWEDMKKWNTHKPLPITTAPKIPKQGSQEYVNNSIKSLYSTLAKHKGSVTKETLTEAFEQANNDNLERKGVSLLEDNFNKQLDWIELIEDHINSGICNTPDYKHLESEITNTVLTCDEHIKNIHYSEKIVERIEARLVFNNSSSAIYKDYRYLQSMVDRLESKMLFDEKVA